MVDVIGGSEAAAAGSGRIVSLADVLLELGITGIATDNESTLATSAIKKAEADVRKFLEYDPVQATRTEYYPMANPTYGNRAAIWEAEGGSAVLRRRSEAATDELQLLHVPLRTSTAPRVWIDYDGRHDAKDTSFPDETEKTEGTDFWASYDGVDGDGNKICRDGILRSFGRWPSETGAVKVTYVAGYTAAEFTGESDLVDASPIYYAVLEEALRRFKRTFALWQKKARHGHSPGHLQSENLGSYSYNLSSTVADRLMSSTALLPETRERLASFRNFGTFFL